jgi:hypothetical protein
MSRKPITKWIIRTFGLPGSWSWALRQMKTGHAMHRRAGYGLSSRKFRLSGNSNLALLSQGGYPYDNGNWLLANATPDDLAATDWRVLDD